MAKTAWIFSYKLRKNVTKEEFMEATQRLHDQVISKAKGFLSWEHYLQDGAQDGTWTDFVLWESEEDARNAISAVEFLRGIAGEACPKAALFRNSGSVRVLFGQASHLRACGLIHDFRLRDLLSR